MRRQSKPAKRRLFRMATRLMEWALFQCVHTLIAMRQSQQSLLPASGQALLIVADQIARDTQTCYYLVVDARVVGVIDTPTLSARQRPRWRARRGHGY